MNTRVAKREDIRRAFGMTVRTLRKRLGIAQEALAYDSGVDRAHMGALERGEWTPTLETIFKLLPHLKVNFVEFAAEFLTQLKKHKKHSAE